MSFKPHLLAWVDKTGQGQIGELGSQFITSLSHNLLFLVKP